MKTFKWFILRNLANFSLLRLPQHMQLFIKRTLIEKQDLYALYIKVVDLQFRLDVNQNVKDEIKLI